MYSPAVSLRDSHTITCLKESLEDLLKQEKEKRDFGLKRKKRDIVETSYDSALNIK